MPENSNTYYSEDQASLQSSPQALYTILLNDLHSGGEKRLSLVIKLLAGCDNRHWNCKDLT